MQKDGRKDELTLMIEIGPRCVCLLIEAPAMSMAKLRRTFPAGYRPNTNGWLLHVNDSPHDLQY